MTFLILRIGFQKYFPVSRSGFAVPLFKEAVEPILSTTKNVLEELENSTGKRCNLLWKGGGSSPKVCLVLLSKHTLKVFLVQETFF